MLRKLLKYEFQATGRIFLPLYGALFIVALIQRVFWALNLNSINNITMNILSAMVPTLFGTIIVAICVVTFIMMLQRFYKNLLQREGYLMFTLPVSVSKLIWSKLIVILVWIMLSIVAGIIAFMIIFANPGNIAGIINKIHEIISLGHIEVFNVIDVAVDIIILTITAMANQILCIYLSMAVGQLANKHRKLCAVGAYIGIDIIINNIIMVVLIRIADATGINFSSTAINGITDLQAFNIAVAVSAAFLIIQAAIYFILTKHILTKRLNLE